MPQPQPTLNKRRTVFTKDARLTVMRFDAAKTASASTPGKIATLNGYAMLWNVLSDDRGGYKVRLLPGSGKAFDPTMGLFHHNFAAILGNTENSSLRIFPDDIGVRVEIDAPDTTTGRDAVELVGKKYVKGMSFAMAGAPKFTMTTEGGQRVMNVSEFVYDEVTVTGIPSFTDTFVELLEEEDGEEEDAPTAEPMAASKKIANSKHHRDAHASKLKLYGLAGLAEF